MSSKAFAPFPIKTRAAGRLGRGAIAVVHIGGEEPAVVDARFARRLEPTLHAVTSDPRISGVILCSDTPSHFAEGPKLAQLLEIETEAGADALLEPSARVLLRLHAMPVPIVAVVDGVATGAGFELALACSGIVAAPRAACSLATSMVGYLPGHHGLQALASRLDPAEAARIALAGETLSATDLGALGLASLSREDPFAEAERLLVRAHTGVPRVRGHHRVTGRAALSLFRKRALASACQHDVARERVFELLHAFMTSGFTASVALERHLAAELAIAHTTKRLVRRALSANAERVTGDFGARLQWAFIDEARTLVAEGCDPHAVDAALVRWGFARGPLALAKELGPARMAEWNDRFARSTAHRFAAHVRPRPRAPSIEEMQARCVLRLVNEAQRCLAEGIVSDRMAADFTATAVTSFPAFRSGPFAYADDLGHEFGDRLRVLERRFGARFAPARNAAEPASFDAMKP